MTAPGRGRRDRFEGSVIGFDGARRMGGRLQQRFKQGGCHAISSEIGMAARDLFGLESRYPDVIDQGLLGFEWIGFFVEEDSFEGVLVLGELGGVLIGVVDMEIEHVFL